MAPEILNYSPYDFKVDVWAWGITIYALVEGKLPYNSREGDHKVKEKIKTQDLDYNKCNLMTNEMRKFLQDKVINRNAGSITGSYHKLSQASNNKNNLFSLPPPSFRTPGSIFSRSENRYISKFLGVW